MNHRITWWRGGILLIALLLALFISPDVSLGQSGRKIATKYGPPNAADRWVEFTIPLTPETFGVDEATFREVMSNVQQLRISTEMADGRDTGGLDDVSIGARFSSNFDSGLAGWSAGGDGTGDRDCISGGDECKTAKGVAWWTVKEC